MLANGTNISNISQGESTEILNKDIDTAINKIMHPLETKDYLSNNLKVNKIGI